MSDLIRGTGVYAFLTLFQRWLVVSLMTLFWGVVIALMVMAFDREDPVTVNQIRVLPPIAAAGDEVAIEFTITRHRVCYVRGEASIFDGANTKWSYEPTTLRIADEALGTMTYSINRKLPVRATPGNAAYQVVLYHECLFNLVHKFWPIYDVQRSLTFEIVQK